MVILMEMKKKLHKQMDSQVNAELSSAYLYFSMAAHFEKEGFRGFASWMIKQANEEVGHAMLFYNYINARGNHVTMQPIKAPKTSWKSVKDVITDASKNERLVSKLINQLMDESRATKDYASQSFLQKLIDEQVEEEATMVQLLQDLEHAGNDRAAVLMLDKEMGSRN